MFEIEAIHFVEVLSKSVLEIQGKEELIQLLPISFFPDRKVVTESFYNPLNHHKTDESFEFGPKF